jgi:hypothetical protein
MRIPLFGGRQRALRTPRNFARLGSGQFSTAGNIGLLQNAFAEAQFLVFIKIVDNF